MGLLCIFSFIHKAGNLSSKLDYDSFSLDPPHALLGSRLCDALQEGDIGRRLSVTSSFLTKIFDFCQKWKRSTSFAILFLELFKNLRCFKIPHHASIMLCIPLHTRALAPQHHQLLLCYFLAKASFHYCMLRTHSRCVAVVVVGGPITFGDAEHHHLHSKNVNCIQFLHFVCETKGSRCSMLRCSTTYHQLVAGGMEEGLILNLNYNSKSAPGFLLFKAGVSGKDNLNCKESVVADANLPSTVIKSAVKLNP